MAHPPSYASTMRNADMDNITEDLASTSLNSDTIKLENCTVSFAIDQSGSTLGGVLEHEKNAIRTVAGTLSANARLESRVLPWSSTAANPIKLTNLHYIDSYGGTTPSSLLTNPLARQALQASDVWFLLTDGYISTLSVKRFANMIAQHGLHGIACVIVIFAPARDKPADCDISVGVSVFAAVPDCLFLYFDTVTTQMYMLQCSGRFTQILEVRNEDQPVLEPSTEWSDLPTVTFADLACVSVRVPKKLSRDQILLPDGLLLNLRDLWQGRLNDNDTVDRIFKNDDNLKSIMLTAQTRGEVAEFQNWLKPFLDDVSTPSADRPELDHDTVKSVRQIIEEIQSGASGERLEELQRNLRTSYHHDIDHSNRSSTYDRRRSSQAAYVRSSQGEMSRGSALSSITSDNASRSGGRRYTPIRTVVQQGLRTPGFQKPRDPRDMFLGDCSLCGGTNANLVLLLRALPSVSGTEGFPAPNSATQLTCPLAIGNFPETDIISPSICCDTCSYYMAQAERCPQGGSLKCVLPLVTYTINREAYKRQLKTALENRFHEDDLVQLLLAIAVNTYQRLPTKSTYDTARKGLKWLCKDLLMHCTCSANVFSQSDDNHHNVRPGRTLGVAVVSGFQSIYRSLKPNSDSALSTEAENLFSYPLSGFVVMALALQHARMSVDLPFGMQNIIWQRFLFQLVENYQAKEEPASVEEVNDTLQAIKRKLNADRRESDASSFSTDTPILTPPSSTSSTPQASPLISNTSILDVLVEQELLSGDELRDLRSLGELFDWIEKRTAPAIYVFAKTLMKVQDKDQTPWEIFDSLRSDENLFKVFEEPLGVSAKLNTVPVPVERAASPEAS